MSLHKLVSQEGRLVHYGLDMPTGGYFYVEFFTFEEMQNSKNDNDARSCEDGMTLTTFKKTFEEKFKYRVNVDKMIKDYCESQMPTPLQFFINASFGKSLGNKLDELDYDIRENWSK